REYSLSVDTSGRVYCFNKKNGLSYFDEEAGTFREAFLPKNNNKILKLGFDEKNQLWLLNSNGEIDVIRLSQGQFKLLHTFRDKSKINNFFIVNERVFYQSGDNELFSVGNRNFSVKKETRTPHAATGMIWYKEHYLLAWASKGYGVYDPYFKR